MLLVLNILSWIISIYTWIVLAWVISGWLVVFRVINPNNAAIRSILRVLEGLVEPALRPIRRILPRTSSIDFSPLVLVVVLWLINGFLLPMIGQALLPTVGP